jgi:hypothetical protein
MGENLKTIHRNSTPKNVSSHGKPLTNARQTYTCTRIVATSQQPAYGPARVQSKLTPQRMGDLASEEFMSTKGMLAKSGILVPASRRPSHSSKPPLTALNQKQVPVEP